MNRIRVVAVLLAATTTRASPAFAEEVEYFATLSGPAEAPAVVKAHGGEYLVRGGRFEVMEGQWQPARIAMLRFPSFEIAKAFYDGELYKQARAKREGATTFFNMVLVEGVAAPVI